MAIGIEMNKKYSKDDIHYYEVDDYSHTPEGNFYIGIDTKKKIINYYKLPDLKNPIGYMDFLNSDKFTDIPGLNIWAVKWAAIRAHEALKKNFFPEGISKQS